MKIAILSFSFLKSKHIERLKKLGEVVEYTSTNTEADAIERLKDVEVVVADCWDVPLNLKVLGSIPSVKYISLNSTGFNQVDITAAKENNVLIANVPGFSTEGVSEQVFALLFAVARKVPRADADMHQSPFQIDPANRKQDMYLGKELKGKTLGVIGLGKIGTRVTEIGKALGMRVIAYNRTPKEISEVRMVDFETLLRESDMISINAAFVPEMTNLFNEEAFKKMKPKTILINTARGEFINEVALKQFLESGHLGGFGADVLTDWSANNPLLGFENVVLSPHLGFYTEESLDNMADIITSNIESYAMGQPANVVTN